MGGGRDRERAMEIERESEREKAVESKRERKREER